MRYVKVLDSAGEAYYLNPASIAFFAPQGGGEQTFIMFNTTRGPENLTIAGPPSRLQQALEQAG